MSKGRGGDEQGDDHAHFCVRGRLLPRAAHGRGDGPVLETHRDGDSGDAAVHPEECVWVRRLSLSLWGAPGPLHGRAGSFLHGHLQGSVHDDLGHGGTSPRG